MKWIFLIAIFATHEAWAATTNHKAHVHGIAKITLALEDETHGTIDLDCPAESIYGFEHVANTPAEKAAQAKGLGQLRGHPGSIVRLPSECEIKTVKVEMEKAEAGEKEAPSEEHHGEHADVNASYSVKCVNSLKGARAWIGMFDVFPRLKAVSFQVLSPSGQSEKKIQSSHEFVTLP